MTTAIINPILEPYTHLIALAEQGKLSPSPQADPDDPDPFLPDDMNNAVLAAAMERLPMALYTYAKLCNVETHPYDAEAGMEYLRRLFPEGTPGLIELRTKTEEFHVKRFWLRPEDIGEEADWVRRMNRRGWPVWVGIAPRKSSREGSTDNCLPCRWLWADMDFKQYAGGEPEAHTLLQGFTPAPSFVVESGGGLHPYWRVEPLDSVNWTIILKSKLQALAQKLGADPTAAEVARVLRLPGTANAKYEPPVRVRMVDYALL